MVKNSLSISCVDFIATKRFSGFSSAIRHRAQAHNVQPTFPSRDFGGWAVTVFSLLLIPHCSADQNELRLGFFTALQSFHGDPK
jgi:hypothetical protein